MRLHTGFVLGRIASELKTARSTKARRCSGGCTTCTWLHDLHIAAPHATVQQRHYEAASKAALAQYRRQFEDPCELAAQ
jgi:hypothetical protein